MLPSVWYHLSWLLVYRPPRRNDSLWRCTNRSERSERIYFSNKRTQFVEMWHGWPAEHARTPTHKPGSLVLIMIPVWNEMSEVPQRRVWCGTSFRSASTARCNQRCGVRTGNYVGNLFIRSDPAIPLGYLLCAKCSSVPGISLCHKTTFATHYWWST